MSGNRTWIYCRIAHGSVLGPDTIEMQRHRLEWYAAQHGLEVVGSSEDCQPGATMDRPGVQKMNQAVERHTVDVVLVFSLDRCVGRLEMPSGTGIISASMESASAQ